MKTKTSKKKNHRNILGELQDAIVQASDLARQVIQATAQLDALKATIRGLALPLIPANENSIKIESDAGTCVIVKVKDHIVLAPGADADVLQLTLPGELWNTFFVAKSVLRPTATDAWMRMSDDQQQKLGDPCPFAVAHRSAQVILPK